ncbi:hypothetical protein BV392_08670 [Rhodovulum sulfidophilum]|nr:hypothetical protein BV392_08670 [Rhodovulum sulfidophilum]
MLLLGWINELISSDSIGRDLLDIANYLLAIGGYYGIARVVYPNRKSATFAVSLLLLLYYALQMPLASLQVFSVRWGLPTEEYFAHQVDGGFSNVDFELAGLHVEAIIWLIVALLFLKNSREYHCNGMAITLGYHIKFVLAAAAFTAVVLDAILPWLEFSSYLTYLFTFETEKLCVWEEEICIGLLSISEIERVYISALYSINMFSTFTPFDF